MTFQMNENPEYLTPDLLGSAYLYSSSAAAGEAFTYVASLTMAVDMSLLEESVAGLLNRFPQFALKVTRKGEEMVYGKMSARVPVFDAGERGKSCPDNGVFGRDFLFAVYVRHKTVFFDFHRALTDEKGVVPFVRAVLFHYLVKAGYEVENDGSIITVDGEFHPIEACDAFVKLDDIPASRPVWYMDAKALKLSVQPGTGPFRVTRVHIPTAKMKGIVRDYLSMPSTILSPFFAEALLETHPEDAVLGEYAIAYIQINLRQYFPTTTLRPFFVNLPLAYNRRLPDYPVATVLMSQKKLLEAQLRTDALAYNAQQKIGRIERIIGGKDLRSKVAEADSMFSDMASSATFSVCNIGSVIMPESMQRYITEFYPVVPVPVFPYGMTAINFKGELVVTVSSAEASGDVCARFVSLLKRYDMPAYISESYMHLPLTTKLQCNEED